MHFAIGLSVFMLTFMPCVGFSQTAAESTPVPFCWAEMGTDVSHAPKEYVDVVIAGRSRTPMLPSPVVTKLELDEHRVPEYTTIEKGSGLAPFDKLAVQVAESSAIRCSDGQFHKELADEITFSYDAIRGPTGRPGKRFLTAKREIVPYQFRDSGMENRVTCYPVDTESPNPQKMDCQYIGRCKALNYVSPEYPIDDLTSGVSGHTVVAVKIRPDGTVESAEPTKNSGSKAMMKASIIAARETVYDCKGSNPRLSETLSFDFMLDNDR